MAKRKGKRGKPVLRVKVAEDDKPKVAIPGIVEEYFKALAKNINVARTTPERSKLVDKLSKFAALVPSIAAYLFYADLYGNFSLYRDLGDRKDAAKRIKELILSIIADTNLYPLHSSLGYSGAATAMSYVDRVADLASYFVVLNEDELIKFIGLDETVTNVWAYVPTYVDTEMGKINIELEEGLARRTALAILVARHTQRIVADEMVKSVSALLEKTLIDI